MTAVAPDARRPGTRAARSGPARWSDRVLRRGRARRRPARARHPRRSSRTSRSARRGRRSAQQGPSFVTSQTWDPDNGQFGAFAFIFGTLVSSAIALVFAVPLSLGIALFITELASKRLRTLVTYVVDLLAAIPSVVYGFWAFLVFTQPVADVLPTRRRHDRQGAAARAGSSAGTASGASFMTAGVILAVMIIADRHVAQPRGAAHGPAGRQERRARDGRDPLGDAARRGVPARAERTRRRGHARARPRDGRDDRGRVRHRQQRAGHVAPLPAPATRWRRTSPTTGARRPASAARR